MPRPQVGQLDPHRPGRGKACHRDRTGCGSRHRATELRNSHRRPLASVCGPVRSQGPGSQQCHAYAGIRTGRRVQRLVVADPFHPAVRVSHVGHLGRQRLQVCRRSTATAPRTTLARRSCPSASRSPSSEPTPRPTVNWRTPLGGRVSAGGVTHTPVSLSTDEPVARPARMRSRPGQALELDAPQHQSTVTGLEPVGVPLTPVPGERAADHARSGTRVDPTERDQRGDVLLGALGGIGQAAAPCPGSRCRGSRRRARPPGHLFPRSRDHRSGTSWVSTPSTDDLTTMAIRTSAYGRRRVSRDVSGSGE
jgi:hypothetical protein